MAVSYFAAILFYFGISTVLACCPNGWIRYDDSCYLFEDVKENWHSARTYCQGLNGDLAVPETQRENNFIKKYLQKTRRKCDNTDEYYWFGANDLTVENDWIMISNGKSYSYSDWSPHEPTTGRDVNCAGYYGASFSWDDTMCDNHHQFVCEIQTGEISGIVGK